MTTQNLLLTVTDNQQLIPNRDNIIVDVLLWLMFYTPFGFCLVITLHDRYITERAAVRQRQIKMLERIWQQNTLVNSKFTIRHSKF